MRYAADASADAVAADAVATDAVAADAADDFTTLSRVLSRRYEENGKRNCLSGL